MTSLFKKIWLFYYEGFCNMPSWGKKAWIIILVKLFIMFFVLKLFFFSNFLNSNFDSQEEKGEHIIEQLTK